MQQFLCQYLYNSIQGKLYIFGGVIRRNEITNEFWEFDMGIHSWTQLASHNDSALAFPMATAGHTAHLIGNEMHILFGYNPYEGYLYAPQIFSFGKMSLSLTADRIN